MAGWGRKWKINQKNLQNRSKNKNNKRLSWVPVVRILSPAGSHSLSYLPGMPSNTALSLDLLCGSSDPSLVLSPRVLASHAYSCQNWCVLSCQISWWPFMHSTHSGCLVHHVQPMQLAGRLGVSFLGHTALGSIVVLFPSARGSSTGVCSWGCPGGPGSAPVRAGCGGGAAARVAGVLAAPGSQGGWRLGQQEIECSRRVWQPGLTITFQYPCLEKPFSDRSVAGQSTGSQRVRHDWSDPACIDTRPFFRWQLCPSECWGDGGAAAWLAGTLAAPTAQGHGLPRSRSYASTEPLFEPLVAGDQASLSVSPPVQAHRGPPCLGPSL